MHRTNRTRSRPRRVVVALAVVVAASCALAYDSAVPALAGSTPSGNLTLSAFQGLILQSGAFPSNIRGTIVENTTYPPPTYTFGQKCPSDAQMVSLHHLNGTYFYWNVPANITGPYPDGSYHSTAIIPSGYPVPSYPFTPIQTLASLNNQAIQQLQALGISVAPGTQFYTEGTPSNGDTPTAEDMNSYGVAMDIEIQPGFWEYSAQNPKTKQWTLYYSLTQYQKDFGASSSPPNTGTASGLTSTGWWCAGFGIRAQPQPYITQKLTPPSPISPPVMRNQSIDNAIRSWYPGTVATLPGPTNGTYLGIPTCSWLQGGNLPNSYVSLAVGELGKVPAQGNGLGWSSYVYEYYMSYALPSPVTWTFHDPSGDSTVVGQGYAGSDPGSYPAYNPVTRKWSTNCQVYHEYKALTQGNSTITITATRTYNVYYCVIYKASATDVLGAFSGGQKCSLYASPSFTWTSSPFQVRQIESVPVAQ